MTTFYLIRHARNDSIGKLIAGRMPGISLNASGREEAQRLAENLASEPIHHVLSSPLERAIETAEPLARKLKLPVEISQGLSEVDYGQWTGLSFSELAPLPEWTLWNQTRTVALPPGGESIAQVQARIGGELHQLRARFPETGVALFTHGDVIKSAIALHLGISLDSLLRFEISPASVSMVAIDDGGARVLCVNRVS